MKMTSVEAAATLIAGVLAFRQQYDSKLEAERSATALRLGKDEPNGGNGANEELEGEDWISNFGEYIQAEGLDRLHHLVGSNDRCIAALNVGEPAFTLRGQDILASLLVKHWSNLAALNGDCPESKIDHADLIAERMESYAPQKWPD